MPKFKVGDRVVFIDPYINVPCPPKGAKGTVIRVWTLDDNSPVVNVAWDNHNDCRIGIYESRFELSLDTPLDREVYEYIERELGRG